MASTDTSQEVAEGSVSERGFHCWQDTSAGNRVSEFAKRGFPYYTEYGLDFLTDFAFDPRIQHILEACFDRCLLAHWLRYEALPDQHIECFRQGGPEAGRRVFMVHVCSKGSQVAYYVGSHLHKFKTTKGLRSVFEVSPEELSRAGCEPEALNFPNGGLVILDARVCFEIKQGYTMTFMFATEDVLVKWRKIVLPNSTILRNQVAEIENISPKIGLNFAFQEKEAEDMMEAS